MTDGDDGDRATARVVVEHVRITHPGRLIDPQHGARDRKSVV